MLESFDEALSVCGLGTANEMIGSKVLAES
jgi:hypothetical protein